MKNRKLAGFIIALLVASFVLAGCNNPKALARQFYKLEQQYENTDDARKQAELESQLFKIFAKVVKMSEQDQEIFEEEYNRLDR